MSQQWFYTKDGKTKRGPISSDELRALARSGLLVPMDMVLKQGSSQWTAASTIKGLFPALSRARQELPLPRGVEAGPPSASNSQPRGVARPPDTGCAERTPTTVETPSVPAGPLPPPKMVLPTGPAPARNRPQSATGQQTVPAPRSSPPRRSAPSARGPDPYMPARKWYKRWSFRIAFVTLAAAVLLYGAKTMVEAEDRERVKTLVERLDDPKERRKAVEDLGDLGPKGKSAIGDLIPLLHDEEDKVRQGTSKALVNIAVCCLPNEANDLPFLRFLQETVCHWLPWCTPINRRDHLRALRTLGEVAEVAEVGTNAKKAIRPLIPLLAHRDHEIAQETSEALKTIGLPEREDYRFVVDCLKNDHANIRLYAAETIAACVKLMVEADPEKTTMALIEASKDRERAVRIQAVIALPMIGPDYRDKVVPALLNAVADDDATPLPEQEDRANVVGTLLIKCGWRHGTPSPS